MFCKVMRTPLTGSHVGIRLVSTIVRNVKEAKGIINCGLNMANKAISSTFHGPTGYEVVKDVDLSGKTCLVTGANSGIGLEMTRCLTSRGGAVLMACRNKYAATVAQQACEPNPTIRSYEVNLASLKSVRKCSNELLKDEKKIDIVILNAGVFGLPWTLTEDMLETTFQVNFLSQFYLLLNIESILAPDARVVFVSSESHRHVKWTIHEQLLLNEELLSLPRDEYTSIKAYNVSKLCGLLGLHYLRYRWLRSARRALAAHPGSFVKTRLSRNWWLFEALYTCMMPFSKNVAASTPLYCATSPELEHTSASYFKDCSRREASALAQDSHLAFRMYDVSREMIGARQELLALEPSIVAQPTPEHKIAEHETLTPNYST